MYEFIEFFGSFCGIILDPVNIILVIILVMLIKNPKTKQRGFLKNIGITFLIGFGFRLLFLPLNIHASSVDYRYFGADTAFFILFSHALFASFIYISYRFLKFFFYINMTPKEIRIYEDKKNELAQIKNLVERFETAKDFECADFLYRLMMFRDKKYTAIQIQAFLIPNENIDLIKTFLLKRLRTNIKLQRILNPKDYTALVWYYTLNSYIAEENKELMCKLWVQLKRGFELAKPKYLQDSSKKFNFDNCGFYQIPKGMETYKQKVNNNDSINIKTVDNILQEDYFLF